MTIQQDALLRDAPPPKTVDLVVLGLSTGGPEALSRLVATLDPAIPCPILVVQHVIPGFSSQMAGHLSHRSSLKIREAKDGEIPAAGELLICPGGVHMRVVRNHDLHLGGIYRIELVETEPVNSCRPAVDVLFDSAAELCVRNMLGVIMTGMGTDGAEGCRRLVNQGGAYVIIQDKESSVIWGMPEAALQTGVVSEIHSLEVLGSRISRLAKGRPS